MTFEDPCVTSERLASGGSASLTGCLDRASSSGPTTPGDDTARPAEKELPDPAASDPIELDLVETADNASTRFPEDAEIPPVGPRPPEPEVVELVGGRVSLSLVGEAIVLNAATPRPGFVADLRFEQADRLTVTFWDGTHLSTVEATVTDDGLDVVTVETPS